MRILLINPPSPFLLDDRVFPPLGLLEVAAVLEAAEHQVEVLDLAGVPEYEAAAGAHMRARGPYDVYGLTATTPQFPKAIKIQTAIRQVVPEAHVILGGPHATVMPESCGMFDKVVAGDGEAAVFEALERTGPKMLDASKRGAVIENLDDLPFPARHLIDLRSYVWEMDGERGTTIMTQRGCPFGCVFCCGRDLFVYRKIRVRTPKNVLDELDFIHAEYGFRTFMIYDDEVNVLVDRTLELCRALQGRDYRFRGFIKAELFTPEVARAMAQAGFAEVCTGVESGSDRILKLIKKNTTVEINSRARRIAREHGIRFKAFTMVGHLGETREDVLLTQQWLIENRPDEFDVTLFTPYPGSPLYDRQEAFASHLQFDKAELDYTTEMAFYKGTPGEYKSYVATPALTREEMVHLRDEVERDVRAALGLPPRVPTAASQFEHSMGQS